METHIPSNHDCDISALFLSAASLKALTTSSTSALVVSRPTLSLTVSTAPASAQVKLFTRTLETPAPV